jgi:hypothetical protein
VRRLCPPNNKSGLGALFPDLRSTFRVTVVPRNRCTSSGRMGPAPQIPLSECRRHVAGDAVLSRPMQVSGGSDRVSFRTANCLAAGNCNSNARTCNSWHVFAETTIGTGCPSAYLKQAGQTARSQALFPDSVHCVSVDSGRPLFAPVAGKGLSQTC